MFGYTPKIGGFILTRDSWIWFYGKIAGIAGLVASGVIKPDSLGLSDRQSHVVMGICAAIGVISAQFASSGLPSKSDAEKVSLPVKESA